MEHGRVLRENQRHNESIIAQNRQKDGAFVLAIRLGRMSISKQGR